MCPATVLSSLYTLTRFLFLFTVNWRGRSCLPCAAAHEEPEAWVAEPLAQDTPLAGHPVGLSSDTLTPELTGLTVNVWKS